MSRIQAVFGWWCQRLDNLSQEAGAQGEALADLVMILEHLPGDSRALALVNGPIEARYLRLMQAVRALPRCEVRHVEDLSALEALMAELATRDFNGQVIVARPLYARFHTYFAASPYANRLIRV